MLWRSVKRNNWPSSDRFLQADHLAEYAAARVGGRHQDRVQIQPGCRDYLQRPEQRVGRSVAPRQEYAQPAEQWTEERKGRSCARDHKRQRCGGARIIHQVSQRNDGGDGQHGQGELARGLANVADQIT
jgi:hypothetical protein